MFSCLLHVIHAIRMSYPAMVRIIYKYDLDLVYCQIHMNATSATTFFCMTTICALIYLRLTFSRSSSPAEWCVIIEILTYLANDITNNPHWSHTAIFAREPDPDKLPPLTLNLATGEFVQALSADVFLHLLRHWWSDSFIDDIISVFVHTGDTQYTQPKLYSFPFISWHVCPLLHHRHFFTNIYCWSSRWLQEISSQR